MCDPCTELINTNVIYKDLLANTEFLRRAEVTAKERELKPVEPEPWMPKAGDFVCWRPGAAEHVQLTLDGLLEVIDTGKGSLTDRMWVSVKNADGNATYWLDDLRPATPEEIAETVKYVPQFGDEVKYQGEEWEVVSRYANLDEAWLIVRYDEGDWIHSAAKVSDLTLIRRPN